MVGTAEIPARVRRHRCRLRNHFRAVVQVAVSGDAAAQHRVVWPRLYQPCRERLGLPATRSGRWHSRDDRASSPPATRVITPSPISGTDQAVLLRPAPTPARSRRGRAAATARPHGRQPGHGGGQLGAGRWPRGRRSRGGRTPPSLPGGQPCCGGCANGLPVPAVPGCWSVRPIDHTYTFGTHRAAERRTVAEYLFIAR